MPQGRQIAAWKNIFLYEIRFFFILIEEGVSNSNALDGGPTPSFQAAKYSPYKKTIAHGFLVLSMISRISFDAFSIENVVAGINYGLDRVRFPNATKSDSIYRGRVSLMEFTEIPGGAKYKLKVEIEIKGEDKPACIAEFIALAYTK